MPSEKITSVQNPRVKRAVRLREHKERAKTGLTIVEGRRELARAMSCGVDLQEVYFCPALLTDPDRDTLRKLQDKKVAVIEVSKPVFARMSFGERQEGLLAVCRPRPVELADLNVSGKPFYVLIEGLEKPGNLGAIVRTCDAAGVDALIVCDEGTDVYNPNVVRASLGTVFALPVVRASAGAVLKFFKDRDIRICATLPQAKKNYTDEDFTRPMAVVIGSEQEGLSNFWVRHAESKMKIPMCGTGDSLNASVSAAVVIYEVVRQRNASSSVPLP